MFYLELFCQDAWFVFLPFKYVRVGIFDLTTGYDGVARTKGLHQGIIDEHVLVL